MNAHCFLLLLALIIEYVTATSTSIAEEINFHVANSMQQSTLNQPKVRLYQEMMDDEDEQDDKVEDSAETSPSEIVESLALPESINLDQSTDSSSAQRPRKRRRRRRRKRPNSAINPIEGTLDGYYALPEEEMRRKPFKYRLPVADNIEQIVPETFESFPRRRPAVKRRRRPVKKPTDDRPITETSDHDFNANNDAATVAHLTTTAAINNDYYGELLPANMVDATTTDGNNQRGEKPPLMPSKTIKHEGTNRPPAPSKLTTIEHTIQTKMKTDTRPKFINVETVQDISTRQKHPATRKNELDNTADEQDQEQQSLNNVDTVQPNQARKSVPVQSLPTPTPTSTRSPPLQIKTTEPHSKSRKEFFKLRRLPPTSTIFRNVKSRPTLHNEPVSNVPLPNSREEIASSTNNITESQSSLSSSSTSTLVNQLPDNRITKAYNYSGEEHVKTNVKLEEQKAMANKISEKMLEENGMAKAKANANGFNVKVKLQQADETSDADEDGQKNRNQNYEPNLEMAEKNEKQEIHVVSEQESFQFPIIAYTEQKQTNKIESTAPSVTTSTERAAIIYIPCNRTVMVDDHRHNERTTLNESFHTDVESVTTTIPTTSMKQMQTQNETGFTANTININVNATEINTATATTNFETKSNDSRTQAETLYSSSLSSASRPDEQTKLARKESEKLKEQRQRAHLPTPKPASLNSNPIAAFAGSSKELIISYTSTTSSDQLYLESLRRANERSLRLKSSSVNETTSSRRHNVVQGLPHESDIAVTATATAYKNTHKHNVERKKLPLAVKSAIIISGAVLALAVLSFFALLLSCKIRQAKSRMKCQRELYREQFRNSEFRQSSRSTSPVVSKSTYNGSGGVVGNNFAANNIHSQSNVAASNRHYYLWQTLRKTFQYD